MTHGLGLEPEKYRGLDAGKDFRKPGQNRRGGNKFFDMLRVAELASKGHREARTRKRMGHGLNGP